jgi:hypothetical protein
MHLKMKQLPALIALVVAGCGGGGSQTGETATTQVTAGAMTACVDVNANWQCDDGDVSVARSATGATGLAPSAAQYVLLETRDGQNARTRLLVSAKGSAEVTGLSTLRTLLAAAGQTAAQISTAEAALVAKHGTALEGLLATGYVSALQNTPVALAALNRYSLAVAAQSTASPTLTSYAPALGSLSTDATWASTETTDTRRQLAAQSSTVLNNNESNRLYLFDASAATISSRQIDLVPPPTVVLAAYPKILRTTVAMLEKAMSVLVDTASAATGFTSTPTTGSTVVLEPGKGIAGIQLAGSGSTAFVLLNMLAGTSTKDACVGVDGGNEGLFKVSLADTTSVRTLKTAPACVHSGFSLIASDAAGGRVAVWDATAKRLWIVDGSTMARQSSIDLQFDAATPPQALAITPGGRYLAAAGYGRLTLLDLATGKLVVQYTGDWTNVSQIAFAGGARRVLLASDTQVHTVALDDNLQLISRTAVAVSSTALRGLAVAADGDSYVATSDATAYWRTTSTGAALASSALPSGLSVQQTALAGNRLVLLARGAQDLQFKLMRLPVGLPTAPL